MFVRPALSLGRSLLFSWGMALVALADVAGNLTIADNGPELTTIVPFAHAFEKVTLRASLDLVRNGNSNPLDVRRVLIDKVEPEVLTVKDGRYPFRRPVLFLSKKEPQPRLKPSPSSFCPRLVNSSLPRRISQSKRHNRGSL